MRAVLERAGPNVLHGTLTVPDPALWWPHTHGEPVLRSLTLKIGDMLCDLGPVGFRTVEVQRGEDGRGFAIAVNGAPVFCRGACWTNPDIVALPCDAAFVSPVANRDARRRHEHGADRRHHGLRSRRVLCTLRRTWFARLAGCDARQFRLSGDRGVPRLAGCGVGGFS